MEIDDLVRQIAAAAKLSGEDVRKKIAGKRAELSNLVSEVGAAHIIANELGMELSAGAVEEQRLQIHDIMEGMKSVNIFGRVKAVYEPREFEREGKKSKVGNFEIFDSTGSARVVLWGEQANLLASIRKNSVIKIINGYVKDGFSGLEVHIGSRGSIEVDPKEAPADLPLSGESAKKISGLSAGEQSVDLVARITGIFPEKTFQRKDGSQGRVASVILGDGTGTIRLSVWDSKIDLLKDFKAGDAVKIETAYTKAGLGGIELHVGSRGRIVKAPAGSLPALAKEGARAAIEKLRAGDSNREIRAFVVDIPESDVLFEFCPTCRKRVRGGNCDVCGAVVPEQVIIANAQLDDGTGIVRAVFYRQQAERFLGFTAKDAIAKVSSTGDRLSPVHEARKKLLGKEFIFSGYVKHNSFRDSIELVVRDVSPVDPVKESEALLPSQPPA